jgi:hypothetical protein
MPAKRFFTEDEKLKNKKEYNKKRYLLKRQEIIEYQKSRYKNNKNDILPKVKHYRKVNSKKVIEWNKNRYNNKKEEILVKHQDWKKRNKDKVKSLNAKWYCNNKSKAVQKAIQWNAENKNKACLSIRNWKENNKEKIKLTIAKWHKDNKDRQRIHWMNRRQNKRNVSDKINKNLSQLVFNKFKNECYLCKSTDRLAIDHHYPLSKGFALTIHNAVLLCKSCNSKKAAKLPESFYSPEQLTDLQDNYGITKQPLKILEQPSLFEARMPKNLERDNVKVQAIKRQIFTKKITAFLINKISAVLTFVKLQ